MRRFNGFKYLSLVLSLVMVLNFTMISVPLIAADITQPEEFYGNININGIAAPVGILITARINDVERGSFTITEAGVYGGMGTFDSRLVVSGQADDIGSPITFWVNGKASGQTSEFVPGASIQLNLYFQSFPLEVTDSHVIKATNYLRQAQSADGSIGSYVASSWIVMAIKAGGQSPRDWKVGSNSIVSYLENNAAANLDMDKATDLERSILSIVAAGKSPYNFGNIDYITVLTSLHDGTQMDDVDLLNDDVWGILALRSVGAGAALIPSMAQYLKDNQNVDGGWGWGVGVDSDIDNTAATVSALLAAGETAASPKIIAAIAFMKSQQQNNGGFVSQGTTNAAGDAWAIRAIRDLGQSPIDEEWQKNGKTPVSHLLSLQDSDGAFKWTISQKTNPEWMTGYALAALLQADWPQDKDVPVISGLLPLSDATVNGASQPITASYRDAISGIDTTSVIMRLDNTLVNATVTAATISYSAIDLSAGNHTASVFAADKAGNTAEQSWNFRVTTSGGGEVGGGGGGGSVTTPTVSAIPTPTLSPGTTDVGSVTDESGRFSQAIEIHSLDKKCELKIESGVVALTSDNQPINLISVTKMENTPAVPSDARIIGLVYDFGPDGATFDPAISLIFSYDPANLPAGIAEDSLTIATWDEASQQWIELECIVDTINHTIQAKVRHFSAYGIIANTSPASFVISDLSISPASIEPNQNIEIEAVVSNEGDIKGTYEVVFKVDDVIIRTKSLTLNGGTSEPVLFAYSDEQEGTHTVNIGDLTGVFSIKAVKMQDPLVIQSLIVGKSTFKTGEPITITAAVRNASQQAQTFTLSLKVNNQIKADKLVTLGASVTQSVEFTINEDVPGDYQASLNNMSVPFRVEAVSEVVPIGRVQQKPSFNWAVVLLIGAGVVITALFVALVLSRKKRH